MEVGTGFHPELTGRENVFLNGAILGMRRREIARRLDEIVEFSGCARYIDTPVKRYSSGMAVRLGFSVAAHLECDILVVDEVLAVGDADFQQRCLGRMRSVSNAGRTVLFVSHNMGAIHQLCDRCALLDQGQLGFVGDVPDAVRRYLESSGVATVELTANAKSDFQFTRLGLFDSRGAPAASFPFDQGFAIRLDYRLGHRVDGLEIGVRVRNVHGMIVFTTQRSESLASLAVPPGEGAFQIDVPGRFLTPGIYFLDIGAHIPNQRMLDQRPGIAQVRIEETGSQFAAYAGTDVGAVFCECPWRDLPADADHVATMEDAEANATRHRAP